MGTDSRTPRCSSRARGSRFRGGRAWWDRADIDPRAGGTCGPGAMARRGPTLQAADANEAHLWHPQRCALRAPGPADASEARSRFLVVDEVAPIGFGHDSLLEPARRGGRRSLRPARLTRRVGVGNRTLLSRRGRTPRHRAMSLVVVGVRPWAGTLASKFNARGAKEVRRKLGYTESWCQPPRLPAGSSGGSEPLGPLFPNPTPGVGGGSTANVDKARVGDSPTLVFF